MATSSIKRNFVVEGQDAVEFADSLDEAFTEKQNRKLSNFDYAEIVNKDDIKKALERFVK